MRSIPHESLKLRFLNDAFAKKHDRKLMIGEGFCVAAADHTLMQLTRSVFFN